MEQVQQAQHSVRLPSFKLEPIHWPQKYGEKPILGVVVARNAFEAEKIGYNKGMWRPNITFQVRAVQLSDKEATRLREERELEYKRRSNYRKSKQGIE